MAALNNQRTEQTNDNYANVVQKSQCPTREQGIIVNSVDGIPIKDYITSMGQVTEPYTVRYASRISNGRILYFMNSKESADKIIGKKLKIGANILEIRPWMNKNKRITLSNANAYIPDRIIEEEFKKKGIRLTSEINTIRAGAHDDWSHVLSFRRHVYINPKDKIPPYLEIDYDETTWYIYLSDSKITCFRCKKEGHLARHCKETLPTTTNSAVPENEDSIGSNTGNTAATPTLSDSSSTNNITDCTRIQEQSMHNGQTINTPVIGEPIDLTSTSGKSIETTTYEENSQKNDATVSTRIQDKRVQKAQSNNLPVFKRPLSTTSSSSMSSSHTEEIKKEGKHRKSTIDSKKLKVTKKTPPTLEEIKEQLSSAENLISANVMKYPLDIHRATHFLLETFDSFDIPGIAKTYTNNTKALIEMLTDIRNCEIPANLRGRVYRIIKKLKNPDSQSADNSSNDEAEIQISDSENTTETCEN